MSEQKTYHAVDVVKYICAIFVIIVHTSPLLPYNADANWMLMTLLGRFVVPFFFISTGYFICLNTKKYGDFYFKGYLRSLIKMYLIWSIIYLPLGLDYIAEEFQIPIFLYPVALIVALIYIGTYFHLWYIPALLLALVIVHWWMKHYRKRYLFTISLVLLMLGALETYYDFIPFPFLVNLVDHYIRIFFTTRNGIFFGLFYVAWGYFIAQENFWIKQMKHHGILAIVFFMLMVVEALIIHGSNNLDSNILLMAAPFTICLFLYCLDLDITFRLPYRKLREYSSLYYFSHAYFLILIPMVLQPFHLAWWYQNHGMFRFFSVLICTHIVSFLLYRGQQYLQKRKAKQISLRT